MTEELLSKAGATFTEGSYIKALEYYLLAAKHDPLCRARIRESVHSVLACVLDELNLQSRGESRDLWNFSQLAAAVVSSFGDDDVILTMIGVKCLDEEMYQQARYFLQAALVINPDCLRAKESLFNLFGRVVNRWHFIMLNDVARNSAYFNAVRSAVDQVPDCSVLDIGSGTGILRFG